MPILPPTSITLCLSNITTDTCKAAFAQLLFEYIGVGKAYSHSDACDHLGIDPRTMDSYITGQNLPPFVKLLRMMCLFGDSFTNRVLMLAGMEGAHAVQVNDIADLALNADAGKLIGDLSRALADGKIDHLERPEIIRDVDKLIDAASAWRIKHSHLALMVKRGNA